MIEIIDSVYEISAPNIKLAPDNELQNEIVFLARSNSGKSSLLNAITNKKSLAKVSATPGKTRLINYFNVIFLDRESGEKLNAKIVDLPGFGYAKVNKRLKEDWESNLTTFISKREQIKIFIHLIDSRHTELEIDKDVGNFLQDICSENQNIITIFTKIDKLNQKEISALKRAYPDSIMVSSAKKRGIDRVVELLYNILKGDVID